MSLGIAFKGPEGIVLAVDSRVTLTAQVQTPSGHMLLPSTYDNATKLLKVPGQEFIGAITYGVGAIGQQSPRTAHSFLPEFEALLLQMYEKDGKFERLSVELFAQRLSDFFMEQWQTNMPPNVPKEENMVFVVGGIDEGAVYGRVFEIYIPNKPQPTEVFKKEGDFGAIWGGQRQIVDRLIQGYDPMMLEMIRAQFSPTKHHFDQLQSNLNGLGIPIPFQFLPLQDCIDLSIFLIRATIAMQSWQIGVRGVGGAIDVATITQTDGFQPIQQKKIRGELGA